MSKMLLTTKNSPEPREQVKKLMHAIQLAAWKYYKGMRLYKNSYRGDNKKTRGLDYHKEAECFVRFGYNVHINGSLFVNGLLWALLQTAQAEHLLRDKKGRKYVSTAVYALILEHIKPGSIGTKHLKFLGSMYEQLNFLLGHTDEDFARYITDKIEAFVEWAHANEQPYVSLRSTGGYVYKLESNSSLMKYLYELTESIFCQYSHRINPDMVWGKRYDVLAAIFHDPETKDETSDNQKFRLSDVKAPPADVNYFKSRWSTKRPVIESKNQCYSAEPMQRMMQAIDDNGFYLNKEELTEVIDKLQKMKAKL